MGLDKLKSEVRKILELVDEIPDNDTFQWNKKPNNGEWSLKEIIHHTADAMMNHFYRSKLLLTLENPYFIDIDLEKWAKLGDTKNCEAIESKKILRGLFQKWLSLLNTIQEQDLDRLGTHEKFGEVTLELIFNLGIDHTKSHLEVILG